MFCLIFKSFDLKLLIKKTFFLCQGLESTFFGANSNPDPYSFAGTEFIIANHSYLMIWFLIWLRPEREVKSSI